MSKLITIIVIAVVIIGGAYWLSGMVKSDKKMPATEPKTETSGGTQTGPQAMVSGPFKVANDSSGKYLTAQNGMTLYINTKDQGGTKIAPACNAACEANWPPYLLGDNEVAPDKSGDPLLSKLNLYKRTDGKIQYAIGTTPLYY